MEKCETDFLHNILRDIVLSGGNTLFPGFGPRLEKELRSLPYYIKVIGVTPRHRECSAWVGGSQLVSMGYFQESLVTKQLYHEFGPSIVNRMCPQLRSLCNIYSVQNIFINFCYV